MPHPHPHQAPYKNLGRKHDPATTMDTHNIHKPQRPSARFPIFSPAPGLILFLEFFIQTLLFIRNTLAIFEMHPLPGTHIAIKCFQTLGIKHSPGGLFVLGEVFAMNTSQSDSTGKVAPAHIVAVFQDE